MPYTIAEQVLSIIHPEIPWVPDRHVNNIPTMQFFTGISRNTLSKSYMLSLTECLWEHREHRNNGLWDTH